MLKGGDIVNAGLVISLGILLVLVSIPVRAFMKKTRSTRLGQLFSPVVLVVAGSLFVVVGLGTLP